MIIKKEVEELLELLQSLSDVLALKNEDEYNKMFPNDNADWKSYMLMIIGRGRNRAGMAVEKLKDIKEQLEKEKIC